mgnify:FL=1
MKGAFFKKLVLLLEPLVSKYRKASDSDREMAEKIASAILKNKSVRIRFLKCTHPFIKLTGNYRTEVLDCKICGFSILDKQK